MRIVRDVKLKTYHCFHAILDNRDEGKNIYKFARLREKNKRFHSTYVYNE